MRTQPFATQLRRILAEFERSESIFGIHRSLFYAPAPDAAFAVPSLFGKKLATPIGPSAGPHTQLSQNIVSAWLCGGRFVELKTVQAKDDLVIPRPCIDMADEGYNVEWSQELSLEQSAHEYIVAWALVHVLPRLIGWTDASPDTIFDMSVGYDLEGIRSPRMTRFIETLADASEAIDAIRKVLSREFPRLADVAIPSSIVNSVTLSTMHGCPPSEIERIARHLLEDRGLHTVVKLNPTLLGKEQVLEILHRRLGFTEIEIPERVFEHDLQYPQAVALVAAMRRVAAARGLAFGVKLSNTLAMANHAGRLPGGEMYMSGRALYPVTMGLFDRLMREFDGDLHVSFSAGADAENVPTILSCGALPVTGCSDLLKPGGVGRMVQWLEHVERAMRAAGATNLEAWSAGRLGHVAAAAAEAVSNPRYRKSAFPHGLPKTTSALGPWDCVAAPCVAACSVEQDVPEYAWLIAQGRYDEALEIILARNPLPGVTGYVCTRLCQTRCTRNDYEESVAIRSLKRVAVERGRAHYRSVQKPSTGRRVAVVGSGPSGLAAAAFLALNGVQVTIFEARDVAGGMMRLVPPFRLPSAIIDADIERITELGVQITLNAPVDGPPEDLLRAGFDAVYVAAGFQRDAPLRIPGADGPGVIAALQLLDRVRRGERPDLGDRAVVVGGGDTAMDAVRTAQRLTGHPATLLYRRTRREMPASPEELEGALEEGNVLEELVSPVEIVRDGSRLIGVRCVRNELGPVGEDGRRSPVPIAGSDFLVSCDAVVVAIGQLPALSFLEGSRVIRHRGGGLVVDDATGCAGPAGVYAGGDVVVEPGSIISACADGRRAAEAICAQLGLVFDRPREVQRGLAANDVVKVKRLRARRIAQETPRMLQPHERRGSALIEATLDDTSARAEALRCVQCTTVCDKCVEVCPNRANYAFIVEPLQWTLPLLVSDSRGVRVADTEVFAVRQSRQILHVDDFCNECGNCTTFCVHQGRPFADKPRLFVDPAAFRLEADNAYHIDGDTIRRREEDDDLRLTMRGSDLEYEDRVLRISLRPDAAVRMGAATWGPTIAWRVSEVVAKEAFPGLRSLRRAAEMAVVHAGVASSLPFLLLP